MSSFNHKLYKKGGKRVRSEQPHRLMSHGMVPKSGCSMNSPEEQVLEGKRKTENRTPENLYAKIF